MTLRRTLAGVARTPRQQIAANVEAVLNARQGFDGVVEVFGVASPEAIDRAPHALRALVADMNALVRRFEPRLLQPAVRFVGRQGSLWALFDLSGVVDDRTETFTLRYHLIFRNVVVGDPFSVEPERA